MAKYEVGDRFICEITNVDESGMGTVYTLNDVLMANDFQMDVMEKWIVPLSEESEPAEDVKPTYTPEDLIYRIKHASDILNQLITAYVEMKNTIDHIPDIDARLKELSL